MVPVNFHANNYNCIEQKPFPSRTNEILFVNKEII